MSRFSLALLLAAMLGATPVASESGEAPSASPPAGDASQASPERPRGIAERLLVGLADPRLRVLAEEVLARNPELAMVKARARAAEQRAPQARSLPDPMAGVTGFLLQPETRVGPQEAMATLSQRLPWFGKLRLREQVALYGAVAAWSQAEARGLSLVTETRRLYHEVVFLDLFAEVVRTDRATLVRYEELARSRYASGVGLAQAVIKIQAEITRADSRLLDIGNRRAAIVASLNALRDLPQDVAIPPLSLSEQVMVDRDAERWRASALANRPELAAADAEIAQAELLTRLAEKEYRPDVTVGLSYTLVGNRSDPAGRMTPPPDNGQDVFGLTAGINVPIWRKRLVAGVQETVEREQVAREAKRAAITAIDQSLGELGARLDLLWGQVRLFEDVLAIQAAESLSSAEAAYAAGTLQVLDLLDAERVLFEVRIATSRALADHAVAVARLEGAIGGSLVPHRP